MQHMIGAGCMERIKWLMTCEGVVMCEGVLMGRGQCVEVRALPRGHASSS